MIAAIILAAGSSTRMGAQNKLLLPYQGKTLVRRLHEQVAKVDFGEIITVLGHEAPQVKAALHSINTRFVINPNFAQGMTSSIQVGIEASHASTTGFMIFLSDLVFLQAHTIQQLVVAFQQQYHPDRPLIFLPTYQGKRGHPICFSSHFKTAILQHQKPNGCKEIVKKNSSQVIEFICTTDSILRDVDTPEDFEQLP